uniref:(California timema) hypothetical protein n=1 Tax=Timema californicum TaxID=61474 RepID=A0A7R9JAF9_TIMCA|nr:unnamed protein product [Timema californicum]
MGLQPKSFKKGQKNHSFDIFSHLPLEITIIILSEGKDLQILLFCSVLEKKCPGPTRAGIVKNGRLLDPRSLLSAALVSRKWLQLCRSDAVLRSKVRRQLRKERRERVDPIDSRVRVLRDTQKVHRPFAVRNGQFEVRRLVDQSHPLQSSQFWSKSAPEIRQPVAGAFRACKKPLATRSKPTRSVSDPQLSSTTRCLRF